ncbi:DNA methyltransferase [Bradyrhizobium pachyrhizi]|uniref:DNA methyltransferase n=1 Tax=Bradyrhizobium pachyrhizi TaxID=280333 RepID=UPI0024B0D672|nr:DNA methyltransferase [Bradyrhizobium pachyrhizi]WFU53611.1 DNA methyltransferase [Bradyrhizobium pachyrhizi]
MSGRRSLGDNHADKESGGSKEPFQLVPNHPFPFENGVFEMARSNKTAGNRLYFGDNLDWLQRIEANTVDLVYLDPPFNSNATYNVLFRSPVAEDASSQITAFDDTWTWENGAERALDHVRTLSLDTFMLLDALRRTFLKEGDVMAYLAMMAPRLLEMRRVMKPTATLYLHCDPSNSHYLKMLLDCVFEGQGYINEISWKRTTAKSDYAQGATHYPRVRDVLLVYRKDASAQATFTQQFAAYDVAYIAKKYGLKDPDGRAYQLDNITGPGGAAKGNPSYEVMGVTRYWRYSREKMNDLISKGLIVQPRPGAVPRFKRYLDTMPGVTVSDDWGDISAINSQAKERLHYPTQKPLQLLERIIATSSKEGDLILDPFCGCGTAIHAAEKMGRRWIGIDVTYLAIQVIQDRFKTWLPNAEYEVDGIPRDELSGRKLAALDPYQFQLWAVGRCGGQPRGKGADRGIDGEIIFVRGAKDYGRAIVSVKAGKNVNPDMIRALKGTVEREGAQMGVFVCLDHPSKDMRTEAATGRNIELPGGIRPRIQIVTLEDLLAGPNLGIITNLNAVQVAVAAKAEGRKKPKRTPTAAEVRESPSFKYPIPGGKSKVQETLPMDEPLLVAPQPRSKTKRRRKSA